MKVFFARNRSDQKWSKVELWQSLLAIDTSSKYELCESIHHADVILFVDSVFASNMLWKDVLRHRSGASQRLYCYDERDISMGLFPGGYTSLPTTLHSSIHHVAVPYIQTYATSLGNPGTDKFLYSFLGAMTHKVREKILSINDERAWLENTTQRSIWVDGNTRADNVYEQSLIQSKFVICPRGNSPNSVRLYEVLESPAIPVIISDEWVPTYNLPWDDFSIRVPENSIHLLPFILRENEDRCNDMNKIKRAVYNEYFAPNVFVSKILDTLVLLPTCKQLSTYALYYKNLTVFTQNRLRHKLQRMMSK